MSTPLAAVEDAAWLRDKKPDLAQALSYRPSAPAARHYAEEDYLTYGRGMKVNMFLPEYANDLLLVSGAADWSECDILLNPKVITAEGEWEAGYWDPKGIAGVARFSSFAHLMEWLYLCEIAGLGERQRLTAEAFAGQDTGSARG